MPTQAENCDARKRPSCEISNERPRTVNSGRGKVRRARESDPSLLPDGNLACQTDRRMMAVEEVLQRSDCSFPVEEAIWWYCDLAP